MSDAAATSGPSLSPDPPADRPARLLPRLGRVLAVLRILIGYATDLTEAMQRHTGKPLFAAATTPFGTLDPAMILKRIACGLRRALMLEERLNRYAARGRDLPLPRTEPRLPPVQSPDRKRPGPRGKRADPDGLPSIEEIAAEVRRRPIGDVIADICRDLGMLPGQCDRELWVELSTLINMYGGRLSRWLVVLDRRIKHALTLAQALPYAESRQPYVPPPAAVATGPPDPGFGAVPA